MKFIPTKRKQRFEKKTSPKNEKSAFLLQEGAFSSPDENRTHI